MAILGTFVQLLLFDPSNILKSDCSIRFTFKKIAQLHHGCPVYEGCSGSDI
uniref:Uncharacterized protein n=1 Tax=Triticum urartu TaxID=4572 RepID=A0A8R7QIX3_TRIUA